MNDLQWALLGVGGALVAGVWGHGKWQEMRQRKLAEGLLNPETGDPLMEASAGKTKAKGFGRNTAPPSVERKEPVIGGADEEDDVGGAQPGVGMAHRTRPTQEAPAARLPVAPLPDNIGEPDTALVAPEADFIARFSLTEPVDGAQLLAMPRDAFSLLRKRVAWIGFEESALRWEIIQGAGRYRELRIGLQLADRSGAINSGLVEQFRKAIEHVGDELTAVPELPPTRDAVARAINLDRLCAEVDIQLAVFLAPRHDHFVLDQVRDTALDKGFRLASDGVLGYHDAAGDRLFSLQMPDTRAPDGLPAPTACCILEVPCVANGELAFDRMMQLAQELADALDALMVDEQRRPITDRFVAPVRQQIGQLQARMSQQGVAAGSPLALRLFS